MSHTLIMALIASAIAYMQLLTSILAFFDQGGIQEAVKLLGIITATAYALLKTYQAHGFVRWSDILTDIETSYSSPPHMIFERGWNRHTPKHTSPMKGSSAALTMLDALLVLSSHVPSGEGAHCESLVPVCASDIPFGHFNEKSSAVVFDRLTEVELIYLLPKMMGWGPINRIKREMQHICWPTTTYLIKNIWAVMKYFGSGVVLTLLMDQRLL
ncbi:hypothetical protein K439DRAFT_1611251 [Ramaria rubella]|nr:hypothetical protein K439DRAFT_1611251 [Ramaria rubella]